MISRDLGSAKVWVSFLNQADQQIAFRNLIKHTKDIQSLLYKDFPIKRVPKIVWQLDEDPDSKHKIEAILDDIKRSDNKDSEI